jgi:hypothetical protein
LAEEDQAKLTLNGNSFRVDLRANEVLTIRLRGVFEAQDAALQSLLAAGAGMEV